MATAATMASTQRLTGMFSGLDTDALVKALCTSQQNKIDKIAAQKTKAEWKKDAYTEINNKLRVFTETYASALSSSSLVTRSAYSTFDVSMASSSSIKVSALSTAVKGSYNLRVDQIATAATMTSSRVSSGSGYLSDNQLNKVSVGGISTFASGVFSTADGEINFSINGKDFNFKTTDDLKTIMDTVNKSGAGVTMAYSQITDKFTITSSTMGSFQNITEPAPLDENATQEEIASYNSAKAAYDADQKKTINFTDQSGFLSFIGLNEVTTGQDAVVYVNGENTARTLSSNTLTLDGIQMNFLRATGAEGVDFDITENNLKIVDTMQKFVDDFNSLMDDLFKLYTTKPDKDYSPLTDAQKAEMSEAEIEKWEAKAKEGVLNRDETLSRLINSLRSTFTQSFGENGMLSDIGIKTGAYMVGETAKLEFDAEKFKSALAENSDKVFNIFAQLKTDTYSGGFIYRTKSIIDDYVAKNKTNKLQPLAQNIDDWVKEIKEQQTKITQLSEKYYSQYAKLETSLAKMQSQQNNIASMLGTN